MKNERCETVVVESVQKSKAFRVEPSKLKRFEKPRNLKMKQGFRNFSMVSAMIPKKFSLGKCAAFTTTL